MDNSCILVISDTQFPYAHQDVIDFYKELKSQFKPTRIIHIGDELDHQSLNFHQVNPDLPNSKLELSMARKKIKELSKLFPSMDLLQSNHGALPYRRAIAAGMSSEFLKDYKDVILAPETWKWHPFLDVLLPNGIKCRFVHGMESNALSASKNLGISVVQGHHHSKFELMYWINSENQLSFGCTVGCMIDDKSDAFKYNKTSSKRPIYGCLIIKNGIPILIPAYMNKNGKWKAFI